MADRLSVPYPVSFRGLLIYAATVRTRMRRREKASAEMAAGNIELTGRGRTTNHPAKANGPDGETDMVEYREVLI